MTETTMSHPGAGLQPDTAAGPVGDGGRYDALDMLRGVAVLGIFAVNIWHFGQPEAYYINGSLFGPLEGSDGTIWRSLYVLVFFKFITLFALMFGAGIALMSDRAGLERHRTRMLWLLFFGAIHAYLIWPGDVLVLYALSGLILTGFVTRSTAWLARTGVVLIVVGSGLAMLWFSALYLMPAEDFAKFTIDVWRPDDAALEAEIASRRDGSWLDLIVWNMGVALPLQTVGYVLQIAWRLLGVMMLGMVLYRTGVLTGSRSYAFYGVMLVVGFGVGVPMEFYALHLRESSGFDLMTTMLWGDQVNYWASLFIASGWLALVMLIAKTGLEPLRTVLAAVGRMAFTNYITQSLIAVTLMYGFNWFATMGVTELFLITLAVWGAQLVWSPLWLAVFRFGPLEWLWRSLTYGQAAPFLRRGN